MQWHPDIINKFVAPEISEFVSAEIPDLSNEFEQSNYWIINHYLNNISRASFKNQWRQVILGFIRRVSNAFEAYHSAREATLRYLNKSNSLEPDIYKYYRSVSLWENFVLQMSMAIDLFKWMNSGKGAFQKNDGSKEQRIYSIANHVKHISSCVNSGQCQEIHSLPLWLNNEGLVSFEVSISYSEVSEILRAASKLVEDLQDPYTLKNNVQK